MSGRSGLLQGLGKATKRGIRKCPQCGTLNGTRGLSCKNRTCDWVFQHPASSVTSTATAPSSALRLAVPSSSGPRPTRPWVAPHDPCLLVTDGSPLQRLFSVRPHPTPPDGLEQRAFLLVHSPVEPGDVGPASLPSTDPYSPIWPAQNACYVPGCAETQGPQGPESEAACRVCVHLRAVDEPSLALRGAEPLSVKHSVLNDMAITSELKQLIWLGARQNGPLVQRVSITTMAVKCQPSPMHPLGFLHVVFPGRATFHCPCPATEQCLHFYSCLAVFASSQALAREFAAEINGALLSEPVKGPHLDRSVPQSEVRVSTVGSELTWEAPVLESQLQMGFVEWLSGVTQTLSDGLVSAAPQFGEKVCELEYHVPHQFCQALITRLSPTSDRLLLPHHIQEVPGRDESLKKQYVWHLNNILQVKKAFDTPMAELEIATEYIIMRDGKNASQRQKTRINAYFCVGKNAAGQRLEEPAFILEWSPQYLSQQLGRLKLRF
ncbi:hypothetical protein TCAL_10942, partial [Tigriopus californicus]